MSQINFNTLYDIIVNWFKSIPPKESRFITTSPEQLGKELAEEHLEIIKDALFDKSIHIVKGITQVDESLLAEYQNVPGWHRK